MTAALASWHHLAVLAKWYRVNRWIRAAIVYPVFVAVVSVFNYAFHEPILPTAVMMPLVVILVSCIGPDRHSEENPDD